jgi:maltose-binding protein MalE
MLNKQWRLLVGVFLVFALVAAACGNGEAEETTTTTTEATTTTTEATTTTTEATTTTAAAAGSLIVWADEQRASIIEDISGDFEAATGLEIEVQLVDFGDIRDNAIQLIPTGEGPDVFIGAHDWTGPLAVSGVIATLDDIPSSVKGEFFEAPFGAFTFDGSLYGLPYSFEAVGLYYNKTLVGDTPPATMDELTAICDGLAAGVECLAVPGGGGADDRDAYHQFPFVSAFGGSIFAFDIDSGYDASVAGVDSAEAIAGVTAMAELVDGGYMPSYNYDNARQAFQDGQAAFWLTGPWAVNDANTGAEQSGFEWGVTKLPTIDGNTMKPFFGANAFFLSAQATNPVAAKTFLYEYIATQDVQQALFDAEPRLPTHIGVFEGVKDDPVTATFTESASEGQSMPNIEAMTGDVWNAWGDGLKAVRNQELSPEDAMKAAGDQIRGLLGISG